MTSIDVREDGDDSMEAAEAKGIASISNVLRSVNPLLSSTLFSHPAYPLLVLIFLLFSGGKWDMASEGFIQHQIAKGRCTSADDFKKELQVP